MSESKLLSIGTVYLGPGAVLIILMDSLRQGTLRYRLFPLVEPVKRLSMSPVSSGKLLSIRTLAAYLGLIRINYQGTRTVLGASWIGMWSGALKSRL